MVIGHGLWSEKKYAAKVAVRFLLPTLAFLSHISTSAYDTGFVPVQRLTIFSGAFILLKRGSYAIIAFFV